MRPVTGGKSLILKEISKISPDTFENSELIIPGRSLPYGIFKLVFTSRMWDDSIADPNWTRKLPFSNNVFTYIRIKKSPLKGMMIKGGVSLITRGFGQTVSLEPYMFAEDPDYPDQQVGLMNFNQSLKKPALRQGHAYNEL